MAISRGYIYQGPRVLKRSRFALAVAVAALACRLLAGAEPPTLSPRELFRLGGIEERQLEVLGRGGPWHEADRQVLRNMLYRIAQDVRPIDLEYWSHGPPDLNQLAEQPEAYRAEVFALRGVVERIEPCELADARGSGSEFALLWRCRLRLESGELVEVLSAKTPRPGSRARRLRSPPPRWRSFWAIPAPSRAA